MQQLLSKFYLFFQKFLRDYLRLEFLNNLFRLINDVIHVQTHEKVSRPRCAPAVKQIRQGRPSRSCKRAPPKVSGQSAGLHTEWKIARINASVSQAEGASQDRRAQRRLPLDRRVDHRTGAQGRARVDRGHGLPVGRRLQQRRRLLLRC